MMRLLLALCALFIPQLVLADMSPTGLFTPVPGDLSVQYLADIFGVVDGVLSGTGSQIMGAMFGVFNAGVLTLGAIVMMYTLIVSTLNTAQDGEVMGQKWSSIWVPLRSAMGFAFLLPKASGYSFIQIFVMWVVVQGVGVGDTVWNAALNYLARGGVIIAPSANPGDLGVAGLINPVAANVFKSQVCMFGMYNALMNTASATASSNSSTNGIAVTSLPETYPNFATTLVVAGTTTGSTPPIACAQGACSSQGKCNQGFDCSKCDCMFQTEFPGPGTFGVVNGNNVPPDLHGMCGVVTWASSQDGGGTIEGGQSTIPGGSSNAIANPSGLPASASDSRTIATQQLILDVQPMAQSVANLIVPPVYGQQGTASTDPGAFLAGRQDLGQAATDYMGMMVTYLQELSVQVSQDAKDKLAGMGNSGWILAGSYYYTLSKFSGAGAGGSDPYPPVAIYNVDFKNCGQQGQPICVGPLPGGGTQSYSSILDSYLKNDTATGSSGSNSVSCPNSSNSIDNHVCWEVQNLPQGGAGNSNSGAATPAIATGATALGVGAGLMFVPGAGAIFGAFFMAAGAGLLGMGELVQALSDSSVDPIIAISHLGVFIVNWVEVMWVAGMLVTFAISAITSIMSCMNPLGYAVSTTMMWFIPLVTAIFLALIVVGGMMAYYVPLIPFIIFLFTAIGWFAAVIESMIAAPLVALGITHPEGHEILGRAEPAVMLLTNVFLRPTLIIMGFLAACILSHVALWLLNQGFSNVLPSLNGEFDILADLVTTVATLIIYVSIVLAIINRCFALIYELPNKILRWLSGGEGAQFGGGEAEAVGQVHGSVEGGMGAIRGGFEASAKTGQDKANEAIRDKTKDEKTDEQAKLSGSAETTKPDASTPAGTGTGSGGGMKPGS